MNWDKIEEEWTTMTRRIRADLGDPAAGKTARRPAHAAPRSPGPAPAGMGDPGAGGDTSPTAW
ncbi:hypothetical protein [Rhodobaculum claviforme]|uniref:Uncharacterized protein n=1 Tax=Rhodobaculum claviforme TaxID=1549854 RepID=A0A934TI54_9RHOB|nr:hypothetical protein [Rhodobaculum claviforme]MBK5925976.1 hypothetical protein [Rhodobaculum claviforme]